MTSQSSFPIVGAHGKLHVTGDKRKKYCVDHSSNLLPIQEKLAESTMSHHENVMLGDKDVMQLCTNLLKLINAKKVLDVGTYTGNSALAFALAIPRDGKVVSMDITDEAYLKHGKKFVDESGVRNKIEFRIQPASQTLDELITDNQKETFDFAFIDADKESYPIYYQKCMTLLKPGGIIAVDNALWDNMVFLDADKDEETRGIASLNEIVIKDTRVNCNLLPIGDGLLLVFKK